MSETLVDYDTKSVNSMADSVNVHAWSGMPDGGYQFTFVINRTKWLEHQESFSRYEKQTHPDSYHEMMSTVWFSMSGKQIEDLYMMHLERKVKGLERLDRVVDSLTPTIGQDGKPRAYKDMFGREIGGDKE